MVNHLKGLLENQFEDGVTNIVQTFLWFEGIRTTIMEFQLEGNSAMLKSSGVVFSKLSREFS